MTVEKAAEIRNELEESESAIRCVIIKLNQYLGGEITEEEYENWLDENDKLLSFADF